MEFMMKPMNRIAQRMWDTLSSFTEGWERGFEERRRRTVLAFFLIIGLFLIFPFAFFHLSKGRILRGLILLSLGIIQGATLISFRVVDRVENLCRGNVLLMGAYFLFLLVMGGSHGSRIFWMLLFPLFASFLLGKEEGFFWSALTFILCLVVFSGLASFIGTFPYEREVITRFLLAYGLITAMSYIVEAVRERYQGMMEERELRLEREVDERTRAEIALEKYRHELEKLVEERTAELREVNVRLKEEVEERRHAEEALKKSEAALQGLFQALPVGIGLVKNRVMQWHNDTMSKMLGYESEELFGKDARMIYPDDQEYERAGRAISSLGGRQKTAEVETRWVRRDGSVFDCHIRYTLMEPDSEERIVIAMAEDITAHKKAREEKKKLERQLQEAQKMEAIGTLAGGIAHDFNNLLMGIQGNASLMLLDLTPDHPHYERLKSIEQQVRSGSELTRQILGFAKAGKYEVKPVDLNKLIRDQNRMFGRTRKEIRIHEDYDEDLWTVEVDSSQIGEVLLNLYVNAWQAMPGGGDLYVSTENVILKELDVKARNLDPGRYVKISVTDTGIGMDADTIQKIFDPFFTTKEMERGTGLGLASAYGIINNHGGMIDVHSEPGKGATFEIYLPATEAKVMESEDGVAEERLRQGSGTILLVDDEEMIIEVGRPMLEALGYEVLVARGGRDALEIYEEYGHRIDMVILDMIMPGMNGGETYDRLKEINPDIRVLLSSGYSINGEAKEIIRRGCTAFIQKPFNIKDLSRKIGEVLSGQ